MRNILYSLIVLTGMMFIAKDVRSDKKVLAPNFTLTDLDGKKVSLSDFRGKVVYMDIWASWCGPCMMEIKQAKKLKEHFHENENIVFLYVSIDENESKWKNMIKKNDIKGVHLISPKGEEGNLLTNYNIPSIPRFVLVDKQGNIADWEAKVPSDYDNIVEDIEKLLK